MSKLELAASVDFVNKKSFVFSLSSGAVTGALDRSGFNKSACIENI